MERKSGLEFENLKDFIIKSIKNVQIHKHVVPFLITTNLVKVNIIKRNTNSDI